MFKSRISFLLIALILMGYVAYISPDIKFPLMIHKLSLVTIAAVLGYFIDVLLFPYFRPHEYADRVDEIQTFVASMMIRRALIIMATVIGISLGI